MLLDKKIPLNYILRGITLDIILTFVFLSIVIIVKNRLNIELNIPIGIPALLGTAISLVLAFKLSQSYDRWWEARKIWGAIVNDSRSLIIQLKSFAQSSEHVNVDEILKEIGLRQIAWCYSLVGSLRKINNLDHISEFISREELKIISNHSNLPLKLVDLISLDIKKLHSGNCINNLQQIQLDNTIVRLCESMGKAERIKSTVFPKMYRIFLRFFIYVFILALAIFLSYLHPLFELTIMMVISLPFFFLNKVAYNLQDPFENRPTDTPINSISRTIEINIKQLLNLKDVPEPSKPEGRFFIM